jgi:magnesium chelatase subunit I
MSERNRGSFPRSLGELRRSPFSEERTGSRTVRDELRENLIGKLRRKETLFPGVVGFDDTVVPQITNALLSRQNFILLGLRGQAKTRILRLLAHFLDDALPYLQGCEIRDNPYRPICRRCRDLIAQAGDDAPIAWLSPSERYVEKLATPDVTIADILGDIDPIKAAREGRVISDELTVHYGLLPRANRGIFAVNELPDLAGKIQVGLFNIMQEGDVQIKGYPVRLPLDVLLVFTANPEDYTARGKIITPLKDRIGSEIRTHYPAAVEQGMEITRQESWTARASRPQVQVPPYIAEVVEQLAFQARDDKRVDKRSGVSQRLPISTLENVVSNAERRALHNGEDLAVPRVLDIYAALPSVTGKLELEYEGELKGGDAVARELVRLSTGKVFSRHVNGLELSGIVRWFESGGALKLEELADSATLVRRMKPVQGLFGNLKVLGVAEGDPAAVLASAAEFILEGLYAQKRISRSEEMGFYAEAKPKPPVSVDKLKLPPDYRRGFN